MLIYAQPVSIHRLFKSRLTQQPRWIKYKRQLSTHLYNQVSHETKRPFFCVNLMAKNQTQKPKTRMQTRNKNGGEIAHFDFEDVFWRFYFQSYVVSRRHHAPLGLSGL